MEPMPAPRRPADFLAMDLGVKTAKALCDRFGAQVVDYTAEGSKGSITLRLPSRRERFAASLERYQAARDGIAEVRRHTAEVMESAERHRRTNRALRISLSELRQSLQAARLESRRIVDGLPASPAERSAGH